jgi:hypothetical protein
MAGVGILNLHRNLPGARTDIQLGGQTTPFKPVKTPIEIDMETRESMFVLKDAQGRQEMANLVKEAGGESTSLGKLLMNPQPTEEETQFFLDFVLWLAGKCYKTKRGQNDVLFTPWLKSVENLSRNWTWQQCVVPGKDVRSFLDILLAARHRFKVQLKVLQTEFSGGLIPAYLYFKYLVRGAELDGGIDDFVGGDSDDAQGWFGDFKYLLTEGKDPNLGPSAKPPRLADTPPKFQTTPPKQTTDQPKTAPPQQQPPTTTTTTTTSTSSSSSVTQQQPRKQAASTETEFKEYEYIPKGTYKFDPSVLKRPDVPKAGTSSLGTMTTISGENIDKMSKDIQLLTTSRVEQEATVGRLTKEYTDLQKELSKAKQGNSFTIGKENEKGEERIQTMQTEINTLVGKLRIESEKLEQSEIRLKAARGVNDEIRTRYDNNLAEQAKLKATEENLRKQIAQKDTQLAKSKGTAERQRLSAEIKKLEAERNARQTQVSKLSVELEKYKTLGQQDADNRRKLTEAMQDTDRLRKTIDEYRGNESKSSERFKQLSANLSAKLEETSKLRAEATAATKRASTVEATFAAYKETTKLQIEQGKQKLENLEQQTNAAKTQLQQQSQQLAITAGNEQKVQELAQQVTELATRKDEYKVMAENYARQTEETTKIAQSKQNEVQQLQTRLAQMEHQVAEASDKYIQAASSGQATQQQLDSLMVNYNKIDKDQETLVQVLSETQAALDQTTQIAAINAAKLNNAVKIQQEYQQWAESEYQKMGEMYNTGIRNAFGILAQKMHKQADRMAKQGDALRQYYAWLSEAQEINKSASAEVQKYKNTIFELYTSYRLKLEEAASRKRAADESCARVSQQGVSAEEATKLLQEATNHTEAEAATLDEVDKAETLLLTYAKTSRPNDQQVVLFTQQQQQQQQNVPLTITPAVTLPPLMPLPTFVPSQSQVAPYVPRVPKTFKSNVPLQLPPAIYPSAETESALEDMSSARYQVLQLPNQAPRLVTQRPNDMDTTPPEASSMLSVPAIEYEKSTELQQGYSQTGQEMAQYNTGGPQMTQQYSTPAVAVEDVSQETVSYYPTTTTKRKHRHRYREKGQYPPQIDMQQMSTVY